MKLRRRLRFALAFAGVLTLSLVAFIAIGVRASDHPTQPAALGRSSRATTMERALSEPGPLEVETVVAATWEVDRAGLINLDHEHAKEAHLEAGPEPIEIYVHLIRHPREGLFMIDTGVERALRDEPEHAVIRGMVADAMHVDRMRIVEPTGDILERRGALAGVFLTHLHLDHIAGLPDVPKGTPIFAGPGETTERFALNLFVQSTTDELFGGHSSLSEWVFEADPDGAFAGVLDVFGDESLFALWVPGHTAGSTAYIARTAAGPVLFAGDTCHTAWGWDHAVEPGEFTRDQAQNRESLEKLKRLAARHPTMQVKLGHQALPSGAVVDEG